MRQRYAVQFQIESRESTGRQLLDEVAAESVGWLRERTNLPPERDDVGRWKSDSGRVSVHRAAKDQLAVFRFEWIRAIGDVEWTAVFQLSTTGDAVQLNAEVHTDTSSELEQTEVRISLISNLASSFHCRRGDTQLLTKPQRITTKAVNRFVDHRLRNPDRELPLIVVSKDQSGHDRLNPLELQDRLTGVAEVWSIDPDASTDLAQLIGRSHSCYGGAVRIYRQGFQPSDQSSSHPFWLENQLRQQFVKVRKAIFSQAAQMAMPNAPEVSYHIIHDQIQEAELEELREAADGVAGQALGQQIRALQRQVERERQFREDLIQERDRYQALYERAQRDLEAQRTDAEQEQSELERVAESVAEAVQIADARSGEQLAFLNSAFVSADESQYPLPQRVLEALSALDELGQELQDGRVSVEQIVRTMNARNFECSTESEDTMRRYRESRRFRDETGQLIEMQKHIKLGGGGGGQDSYLRIHFEWVEDYRQIVVGHVGRHLRTSRM